MAKEMLPTLPEKFERYLQQPYSGLFGKNALAKIVEEIVADPSITYRPKYLEELTGYKPPTIRKSLMTLTSLGLIENISDDVQHPQYRVITESKKFVALSLLAYAVIDDRDGTDCMDMAIEDYYNRVLIHEIEPLAVAATSSWSVGNQSVDSNNGPYSGRYTAVGA